MRFGRPQDLAGYEAEIEPGWWVSCLVIPAHVVDNSSDAVVRFPKLAQPLLFGLSVRKVVCRLLWAVLRDLRGRRFA